jgi:hypothetical protein
LNSHTIQLGTGITQKITKSIVKKAQMSWQVNNKIGLLDAFYNRLVFYDIFVQEGIRHLFVPSFFDLAEREQYRVSDL